MNRVDYIICRLGQLRARGVGRLWALWLTRLELGEHPAGQTYTAPAAGGSAVTSLVAAELADRSSARRRRRRPGGAGN
jgi:hypothetical protein